MRVFEVIVALLLGGAALAAVARRFGAPYPALMALAGAALALIPGLPTVVLDPELALALFVAPVLVDAAFDASPRDRRATAAGREPRSLASCSRRRRGVVVCWWSLTCVWGRHCARAIWAPRMRRPRPRSDALRPPPGCS